MDDAIAIGQENKVVIDLARNWCAHLTVERFGGTGLVEMQTGLPIGMRQFKCPHASAAGMAGMKLEGIAVDFHDRNCVGCTERIPVRLPNLSQLVGERDRRREAADAEENRARIALKASISARAQRRSELSKTSGYMGRSLYEIIDRLDREPGEEASRILLETTIAARSHFDSGVQESLFDLAAAEGSRSEAALEALDSIDADPNRLCQSALAALAEGGGFGVAASIVEKHLAPPHRLLATKAIPTLIALAAPVHGFGPFPGTQAQTKPLLAVYRLFPDLVVSELKRELQSPEKFARIQACHGIAAIAEFDPEIGLLLLNQLISSLRLPDDMYGEEGSANGNVAIILAQLMLIRPEQVDARIQRELATVEEAVESALLRVYELVLRSEFESNKAKSKDIETALDLAYGRFVAVLTQLGSGESLSAAISFLRYSSRRFLHRLENHADTLLGAAALIAAELEEPDSPISSLDINPDPLKSIEIQSRRMVLSQCLGAIIDVLSAGAAKHPQSIGLSIIRTFELLDDKHERLKAALMESLGLLAKDPKMLPIVLPSVYQAMTNQSVRVRGAAADAYAVLAAEAPKDLPTLVHEGFLLLLMDPYVFVHTKAIEALDNVTPPEEYRDRVVQRLWGLVCMHSQSGSHEETLCRCIRTFLGIWQGDDSQRGSVLRFLISTIDRMKAPVATEFVTRYGARLRGTPGLGLLVTKLLGDRTADEYATEDLVTRIRELPNREILELAPSIRASARECARRDIDITDEILEILTAAGAWKTAEELAREATDSLGDTVWDRPRKLTSRLRETATQIENASADGDTKRMRELADSWLQIKKDLEEDNEKNKKKRSPIFGLPLSDPSD